MLDSDPRAASSTYVSQLEEIIKNLIDHHEEHHPSCNYRLNQPRSWLSTVTSTCNGISPPTTAGQSPSLATPSISSESSVLATTDNTSRSPASAPSFIFYDHAAASRGIIQSPKERRSTWGPETREKAKALVQATPKAGKWWESLHEAGAGSEQQNQLIITFLFSGERSFPDTSKFNKSDSASSNILVQRSQNYAIICRERDISATLSVKLVNFQKFILVSMCVVLCDLGFPDEVVDSIMRVGVTQSGDTRYLSRLRQTAIWMNRLIDRLNSNGWDNRGSELLLLWGKPPSYYMRFSYLSEATLGYFVSELSSPQYTKGFLTKAGWINLFVPSVVQQGLGKDGIHIARVSHALRYQKSDVFAGAPGDPVSRVNPWGYFNDS